MADFLAEDRLEVADGALENADPPVEPLEDLLLDGPLDREVEDEDPLGGLSQAVEPADPLLDDHRVPGKVVVEQDVAELEVEAFATHLAGEQDLDLRVLAEGQQPLAPLVVLRVGRLRGDVARQDQAAIAVLFKSA